MSAQFLATDQYGNKEVLITKFPRKELMERMGYSSATKIYVGEGTHCGWKVGPSWWNVWKLVELGS